MTICTLTAGGTVITLPSDIDWTDEYGWSSIGSIVEVSSGGSLIVEVAQQNAGRPITLSSGPTSDLYAIPNRAVINAIYTLVETLPTGNMTLVLFDGRSFTVSFRYQDIPTFIATPLQPIAPRDDTDLYSIILKLMVVA
jgi:hypothetical protein